MVLEGFNRTADGRPFDFPLTTVDAQRWQRLGELSVEEAAFAVAGFEPPPIAVIRYRPIPYQERPGATWARPKEYDDFVRAATSAIERGIVSARSKIQDMHTVQLVELFDVLEWAEATGFTVALKLDGPRPARKSAPVQSVESDSTPAAEPVADGAIKEPETKEQRQERRLQACIDAGLPTNTKAALSRLPDGVGVLSKNEWVTRQAFSADVKAALKRRESAIREGATVHRA